MSPTPRPDVSTQASAPSSSLFPITGSWMVATAVAAVMVLLALLGVGLTTANAKVAPTYWVCLVPVFGAACVALAWARARGERGLGWSAVMKQVLHWVGIGLALGLDFYIRGTGEESGTAAGMNALLLLTVGCYLAGVHLDWMFILLAALLSVSLLILTKAQEYFWVIFVVGAVTIVVMIGLRWLLARSAVRRSAAA